MKEKAGRLAEEKEELRQKVKRLRRQLTEKDRLFWDRKLAEQILFLGSWQPGDCVYCYISVRNEAGTEAMHSGALEQEDSGGCSESPGERDGFLLYFQNGDWNLELWEFRNQEKDAERPRSRARLSLCREWPLGRIFPGLATEAVITTAFLSGEPITGR